jgi:hypothetical protein
MALQETSHETSLSQQPREALLDTLLARQAGEDVATIATDRGLILHATPVDPGQVYDVRVIEQDRAGRQHALLGARLPAVTAVDALSAALDSKLPDIVLDAADRAAFDEQAGHLHAALRQASAAIVPEQIAALMQGAREREAAVPRIPDDLQRPRTRLEDLTPPTRRWEPVVRAAAGEAVIADAGWPGLAAGLDRAAAAGWDVNSNLPRLVAQRELPTRRQTQELYCRLVDACEAAAPTATVSVAEINGRDAQPAHSARHHAELARTPAPHPPQSAPAR